MSRYADLERPPLHEQALRRALVVPGGVWTELRVVGATASTNADVAAAARAGAPAGLVLAAEEQTAGRGRLGRVWVAPARSGLAVSVLLRPAAGTPAVAPARYGWLPLLAGLAVATAVRHVAAVEADVKWPNDVLVGDRKLAGILAERVDDAVVLGIGLNVSLSEAELPVPAATSLRVAGAPATDREPVLRAVLRELGTRYAAWCAAAGDLENLREAYRERCATIGREVRVLLPGDRELRGMATDVDAAGRLVVETADGREAVAAGDVVHVRPVGRPPG